MNQVALGAAIPFAAATAVYAARRFRASTTMLAVTPALMALSALWAVIPDVPRLVGWTSLYMRLAQDPRINIFWWHYTIDQIEEVSAWPQAALVLMLAGLVLAAWRELRLAEGE